MGNLSKKEAGCRGRTGTGLAKKLGKESAKGETRRRNLDGWE